MTQTKEGDLKIIPPIQLLKAAKQAGFTREECLSSSSASFSLMSHMLHEQACLQLADKLCQVAKKRKEEKERLGSALHGFSLLLSLLLLPNPRCCWYV